MSEMDPIGVPHPDLEHMYDASTPTTVQLASGIRAEDLLLVRYSGPDIIHALSSEPDQAIINSIAASAQKFEDLALTNDNIDLVALARQEGYRHGRLPEELIDHPNPMTPNHLARLRQLGRKVIGHLSDKFGPPKLDNPNSQSQRLTYAVETYSWKRRVLYASIGSIGVGGALAGALYLGNMTSHSHHSAAANSVSNSTSQRGPHAGIYTVSRGLNTSLPGEHSSSPTSPELIAGLSGAFGGLTAISSWIITDNTASKIEIAKRKAKLKVGDSDNLSN